MNSKSNALTLLGFEYESDSSDENECKQSEDNCLTNQINTNTTEEDINKCVESTLNNLIESVCNVVINHKNSNHFSYNSKSFSKTRCVRSDAEIEISLSSSSSSSWSLSSDEDLSDEELMATNDKSFDSNKSRKFVKTKGELSVEDLPPIENLAIKLNVEELTQMGRVVAIVEQLVIVQSFRLMPALDLDSVLFLKDGHPLGSVFDVFGPVVEPRYSIRFNSNQQIVERNIRAETPVYYAADQQMPITGYVFTQQLRQLKGSDASWKHNNEPPVGVGDEYSDDETERLHKLKERAKGRRRNRHKNNNHNNNYNNQTFYGNHSQRNNRNSGMNVRVPPNTPNSPYNQYFQNHYQQFPYQLTQQQNNWFANPYQ